MSSPHVSSISRILPALILALAFAFAIPSLAQADSHSRSISDKAIANSASYWTDARINEAISRAVPLAGSSTTTDPPGSRLLTPFSAGAKSAGATTSAQIGRHQAVPPETQNPAIGKLIMRWRGSSSSCSGTLVKSGSLRLVLTAAHCLKENGTWSNRVRFVPAFRDGSRPYGTWAAKDLWITQAYADRSRLRSSNYDLGMVVLKKRLGKTIEPLPIKLFPDRFGRTELYGYPGGAMRGQELRVCSSPTWAGDGYSRRIPGPIGMAARCNMAGGSSGGPWISRYDDNELYVDGVISTGNSRNNVMTTSYFGRAMRTLLNDAENR